MSNIFTLYTWLPTVLITKVIGPGKFNSELLQGVSFSYLGGEVVPEGYGPNKEGVLVVVSRGVGFEKTQLVIVTGFCVGGF
jgi:hypothetical protein